MSTSIRSAKSLRCSLVSTILVLSTGCYPNTGHQLTYEQQPKTVALGESAPIVYGLSAPRAWQPMRFRLSNPQIAYSDSAAFQDPSHQKCQIEQIR